MYVYTSSWLKNCSLFDFAIIITCEAQLHVGKMTLPFCRRLGSKIFKDLINMLTYQYAYFIAKGEQAKELETCKPVPRAETQEDFTSQKTGWSVLLCPFKKILKIDDVCMNVAIVLCMNSYSRHSSCDNSTSALLFSQGWWNRDDHDRPWKSKSGRILNESPIKF